MGLDKNAFGLVFPDRGKLDRADVQTVQGLGDLQTFFEAHRTAFCDTAQRHVRNTDLLHNESLSK